MSASARILATSEVPDRCMPVTATHVVLLVVNCGHREEINEVSTVCFVTSQKLTYRIHTIVTLS